MARVVLGAALDVSIGAARSGGAPDVKALETVRDSIAAVEAPEAADVEVGEVFVDTYTERMCPERKAVEKFAERTGATG